MGWFRWRCWPPPLAELSTAPASPWPSYLCVVSLPAQLSPLTDRNAADLFMLGDFWLHNKDKDVGIQELAELVISSVRVRM